MSCGVRPPRISRSCTVVAPPHRHLTQPHSLLSSYLYLYYFLRAERRRPHQYPPPDILRSAPIPDGGRAFIAAINGLIPTSAVAPAINSMPLESLSNPGAHLRSMKRLFLAPRYAHPDHDKWALNVSVPPALPRACVPANTSPSRVAAARSSSHGDAPLPHLCRYENIQVVSRTVPRATCPFSSVTA
jgi:hypothetical protein